MLKLVNFTCNKSSISRIGLILNASHDNLIGNVIDLEKCKHSLLKGKTNSMISMIQFNNNNPSSLLTNLLKDIIKSPPNDAILPLNQVNLITILCIIINL